MLLNMLASFGAFASTRLHNPTTFASAWTVADGLPLNHINDVVQTKDGYVWAATNDGLVRFDGRSFFTITTANNHQFRDNQVRQLRQDGSGTLWILTREGLVSGQQLTFTDRTPSDIPSPIRDIWIGSDGHLCAMSNTRLYKEDHGQLHVQSSLSGALNGADYSGAAVSASDGSEWVGTADGHLIRISANQCVVVATPRILGNGPVYAAVLAGHIYAACSAGLVQFDNAQSVGLSVYKNRDKRAWTSVCTDTSNTIWLSNGVRVVRYSTGSAAELPIPAGPTVGDTLLKDNFGTVYLAHAGMLWSYSGGQFQKAFPFVTSDSTSATTIFTGSNSFVWIGTAADGLVRVADFGCRVWDKKSGMPSSTVTTDFLDHNRVLWLATSAGGVGRIVGGIYEPFVGSPASPLTGMVVTSITQDLHGDMYFADDRKIIEVTPGPGAKGKLLVESIPTKHIEGLATDNKGDLWVLGSHGVKSVIDGKLFHFVSGRDYPEEAGDSSFIRSFADGSLLIGFARGFATINSGIFKYEGTDEGCPDARISDAVEDTAGDIWLATQGDGLLRFRDGAIKKVSINQGLVSDNLYELSPGPNNMLYVGSARGIYGEEISGLNTAIDSPGTHVVNVQMGKELGLSGESCTSGRQPRSELGADGTVWMVTRAGLEQVSSDFSAKLAPDPVIDQANTPDNDLLDMMHPHLPFGTGTLIFHYSTLCVDQPSLPLVSYRLLGLDRDWINAGSTDTASYSGLQPGVYQFQVRAQTGSQQGQFKTATLPFVVLPTLADSSWVRTIILSVLIAAAVLIYRWRVRVLKLANNGLDVMVTKTTDELLEANDELKHIQRALGEQNAALAAIRGEMALQNNELQSAQAVLGNRDGDLDFYRGLLAEARFSLEAANKQLDHLQVNDKLTNLRNHRAFHERLEEECDRIRRYPFPMGIVMLDLDDFASYNAAHGHAAGDEVLKQIAVILTTSARDTDFVARYEDEKFFVILPHTDRAGAAAAAERFRSGMAAHEWPHEPVTASFGVCEMSRAFSTPSRLIEAASAAVQFAKKHGKNQVTVAPVGHKPAKTSDIAA